MTITGRIAQYRLAPGSLKFLFDLYTEAGTIVPAGINGLLADHPEADIKIGGIRVTGTDLLLWLSTTRDVTVTLHPLVEHYYAALQAEFMENVVK